MNGLLTLPSDVENEWSSVWRSQETDSPDVRLLVQDEAEFDRFIRQAKPYLLERATNSVGKVLREIDNWENTVAHEKLATRLGFEMLERFLGYGRAKVPCRPLLLLDSFLAKSFSSPDCLFLHRNTLNSPLGRFLEGLISRAVLSRDALISLFWHLYQLSPSQVITLLGFPDDQSQRIFKNYSRWRKSGWMLAMSMTGITDEEIADLEAQAHREADVVNRNVCHIVDAIQPFYRKSEPDCYPCLTGEQWSHLYAEGYGQQYRMWHLAMCRHCVKTVAEFRIHRPGQEPSLPHLHIRPGR